MTSPFLLTWPAQMESHRMKAAIQTANRLFLVISFEVGLFPTCMRNASDVWHVLPVRYALEAGKGIC